MGLSLADAIARCRNLARGREVWCITRYDNSDRNIDVFWSTADATTDVWVPRPPPGWDTEKHHPYNAFQLNRLQQPKTYGDGGPMSILDDKRLGARIYQRIEQQVQVSAAKHAEEYFLDARHQRELGCSPRRPELVEIFVRWSPCHHSSVALAPPGCATKLGALAVENKDVRFQIFYDAQYTGEGPGDCFDAVLRLNLLHNVIAHAYSHYQPL